MQKAAIILTWECDKAHGSSSSSSSKLADATVQLYAPWYALREVQGGVVQRRGKGRGMPHALEDDSFSPALQGRGCKDMSKID